jgi:isoleucyl-tRNA synthetase
MGLKSEEIAPLLLNGQTLSLRVNGEPVEILPEEVEVRAQARAGYAVASEGAYLAALVTELTPELEQEGLARELVRRVQDLRKQAEFDIADRIVLYYQASPKLTEAIGKYKEYIMGETLSVVLKANEAPAGLPSATDSFDGEEITVAIEKSK